MKKLFVSLGKKLLEALISVAPVAAIVVLLSLTPLVSLSGKEIAVFLVCAVLLILGISLFNLGADLAMTPMGDQIGSGLSKTAKIPVILLVCFLMGMLITVAEPDLSVLASQVSEVINGTVLIISVGVGVGLFLLLAVIKIVRRRSLSLLLMFFYFVLFALASLVVINGNADFLALAFDSGGVTTGPITVPFIMAFGVGIAMTLGGRNAGENSFGLIAMCSVGPVIAVMALGIFSKGNVTYSLPDYSVEAGLSSGVGRILLGTVKEVMIAIGLVLAFFIILQLTCLKLPKKKLYQIGVGTLYTVLGLVIFLTAVKIGFMPVGYKIGTELSEKSPILLVVFGFVIGMLVVLAEPAVHVLNRQVEEITDGTVSKRSMMIALSVGVGVSIGLSMIRAIFDFNIMYYLIPGYFISLGLSFFVPGLYTAIAFDSGGVASGPLTSSFILPFAIGVCAVFHGEGKIMTDAFGIVAMVAMTPLITIQTLGFRAIVTKRMREKIAMRRILGSDDEQIINFM